MTREVMTLLEEDNLEEVTAGLARFRFHHLPVVDGDKLVGMLSHRDMLHATVAGFDRSPAALAKQARFLEQTFVRDVMKTHVFTAAPEETIRAAAQRMLEHRVGALPVVDENFRLLGIITENDIVRTVAEDDERS
jgi:Mg/Co/Ni transporter MgtE